MRVSVRCLRSSGHATLALALCAGVCAFVLTVLAWRSVVPLESSTVIACWSITLSCVTIAGSLYNIANYNAAIRCVEQEQQRRERAASVFPLPPVAEAPPDYAT